MSPEPSFEWTHPALGSTRAALLSPCCQCSGPACSAALQLSDAGRAAAQTQPALVLSSSLSSSFGPPLIPPPHRLLLLPRPFPPEPAYRYLPPPFLSSPPTHRSLSCLKRRLQLLVLPAACLSDARPPNLRIPAAPLKTGAPHSPLTLASASFPCKSTHHSACNRWKARHPKKAAYLQCQLSLNQVARSSTRRPVQSPPEHGAAAPHARQPRQTPCGSCTAGPTLHCLPPRCR